MSVTTSLETRDNCKFKLDLAQKHFELDYAWSSHELNF